MVRILIGVINPFQSEKTNVDVPGDVEVRRLIEAMVEEMDLPIHASNGRPNRYQLSVCGEDGRYTPLSDNETLAQSFVRQGDTLKLTVEEHRRVRLRLAIVYPTANNLFYETVSADPDMQLLQLASEVVQKLHLPMTDAIGQRLNYNFELAGPHRDFQRLPALESLSSLGITEDQVLDLVGEPVQVTSLKEHWRRVFNQDLGIGEIYQQRDTDEVYRWTVQSPYQTLADLDAVVGIRGGQYFLRKDELLAIIRRCLRASIQQPEEFARVVALSDKLLQKVMNVDAQGREATIFEQSDVPTNVTNELAMPTIGIITVLPEEYAAVEALLQSPRRIVTHRRGAGRHWLLGEVPSIDGNRRSVVLSLAEMGNNMAATRATLLLTLFPRVEAVIMVGIAGGIPYPEKPDEHVRLGDVVVSNQKGVIQYDFDKETINEVIHRHLPRPPSAALLDGVRLLKAAEIKGNRPWLRFIDQACLSLNVSRPPAETDILVTSTNPNQRVRHPKDSRREKGRPRIFIGPIASANKLLKNPVKRDELRDKFGVKAVEMEGSGIADATWNHEVGYLVVRGICDYCDSNKGDTWHNYAAVVAAAYTRALLESIPCC